MRQKKTRRAGVALLAIGGLLVFSVANALAQGPPIVNQTDHTVNETSTEIDVHPCTGEPAELTDGLRGLHLLRGRLGCDRVELPLAGDALELVGAAVLEDDAGTDDRVLNGLRRQYLVWPREGADSGSDVNGDAAELRSENLELTRVGACAHAEPDAAHRRTDRLCGSNRPGGAIEGGQESVARPIDLPPSEVLKLGSNDLVVTLKKRAPFRVADAGGVAC